MSFNLKGREFTLEDVKEMDTYLLNNGDFVRVYLTVGGNKDQEIIISEWEPTIDGERDCYKETKRFTLDEADECIEYALARHDKFAEVWNI